MAEIEKAAKGVSRAAKRVTSDDGPLGKPLGLAIAGATVAAIPFVAEKLVPKLSRKTGELAGEAKSKATSELKGVAKDAMPDSPGELLGGGPLKRMFSGDDSDDEDSEGRAAPGFGSGRRMPIQQAVDVAVPVKQAYNAWTRFEEWPEFMHRIESAQQIDDTTVAFQAKAWGVSKRFEAEIVEQRPDRRIEWNVTQGYAHTGVVSFHSLSTNLTRVDLSVDIQPSNVIDKASRGMRFAKRMVRGDMHRFKAYVELGHDEQDGWRGTIEDGEVKRRARSRSGSSRSGNGSDPSKGSKSKSRSKR